MRKASLILFVLIAVFSLVTFVACNSDVVQVRSVTLDMDSIAIKVGEAKTLRATVSPADAADVSVTWTSSDEAIATVAVNGRVTAVSPGTATITVTSNFDNTKKATCTVKVVDPLYSPLTLELKEAGDFTLVIRKFFGSNLYYSYNDGEREEITTTSVLFENCSVGDTIALYRTIVGTEPPITIRCSSDCYVYGNVMSLIDSENYATKTDVPEGAFKDLFKDNGRITNHPDYDLVLPATTLAPYCYHYMFSGCVGLKKAPELPATTLDDHCYSYMFSFCTGLTEAPELPVTALKAYCYQSMFEGCTALKEAPALPAETLVDMCYDCMFYECSSLSSIICLATVIPSEYCTSLWVYGTNGTGTFFKNPNKNDWGSGNSGIPAGWTIVDYPTT